MKMMCKMSRARQPTESLLTSDPPGVAAFQDDLLVSGKDAKDHLINLERLLTWLNEKGLRCRQDKCLFAQSSVEYLGTHCRLKGSPRDPKSRQS